MKSASCRHRITHEVQVHSQLFDLCCDCLTHFRILVVASEVLVDEVAETCAMLDDGWDFLGIVAFLEELFDVFLDVFLQFRLVDLIGPVLSTWCAMWSFVASLLAEVELPWDGDFLTSSDWLDDRQHKFSWSIVVFMVTHCVWITAWVEIAENLMTKYSEDTVCVMNWMKLHLQPASCNDFDKQKIHEVSV